MIENVKFRLLSYKNEVQANQAVAELKSLLGHNGWKFFIEKVIDLNIRFLRRDLETNDSLTKEQNDIIKRDLRFLRNLKKLPEMQVKVLQGEQPEIEDADPYYKDVEEMEKETEAKVVDITPPDMENTKDKET